MAVTIQWRRDTAANWATANPILAQGEPAVELDTKKFKIGDGTTAWNSLAYGGLNGVMINPILSGAAQEAIVVSAIGFAGYTFNVTSGSVQYITANSTANGTLNIRGDASNTLNNFLAVNASLSIVLDITNGSSAYYPNLIQIDGTTQTVKWNGGTAISSGNASAVDRYVFQIIKTAANTYSVMGTQVKFA
jgi:hypothetical protein